MTTTVTVATHGKSVLVEKFIDTNGTPEGMNCIQSTMLPPGDTQHQFYVSGNETISVCEAGENTVARDLTSKNQDGGTGEPGATTGTVNQIGDVPSMPPMPEPGSADDKADMGNLDDENAKL